MSRRGETVGFAAIAAMFVALFLVILVDQLGHGGRELLLTASLGIPCAILVFTVVVSVFRGRQEINHHEMEEEEL